jgi:hypothetical protein
MLIGAGFRLVSLRHEALNGDELFSRRVVLQPLPLAYEEVRNDLVHPPLYYLSLKAGTAAWGTGAMGLRLLSLVFGIATIGLVALLGSRLPGSRWSGLLAAAGVAVGRYDVFYSQEARSYAMYTFLVVLLVLWVAAISKRQRDARLWLAGLTLMVAVLYTHYVGSLYILSAVLALLVCRLESRTKILAVVSGAVTLLLFTPWLAAVAGVYKQKHGVGENLDWQGHPSLAELKQVWAMSLGVPEFRGATSLVLLLIIVLTSVALLSVSRRETLRRSPSLVALALLGLLPPSLVFVISNPPLNLPLFGLRHLLPSTVLLLLLCCYGLECAARLAGRRFRPMAVAGAICILALSATPTLQALHAGPTRFPYDRIAELVKDEKQAGVSTYTAWFYGEGEPVNFYCHEACVQALPDGNMQLPAHIVLLYRPHSGWETKAYRQLSQKGYVDKGDTYYTDGLRSQYGVLAAELEKAR